MSDGSEVLELAEKIKPLLAGRGPDLQGGVLANLTAMWLAGNFHKDGDEATAEVRNKLLQVFLECVRDLTPIFAKEIEGSTNVTVVRMPQ